MKPTEIIDNIVKEGKLKDGTIGTVTEWIVQNQGKKTISKYLSAIDEDDILTLTPEGKQQGKIVFKRLHHSPFFNGLAIKYSLNAWFDESEQIFKAILSRTPNDVDSILNYGAIIFNMTMALSKRGREISKDQLVRARSLIFKTLQYDKKVHEDWRTKPSFKNLCHLRAIEAVYYYNKKDSFTAFILGWLSIEMSLYRIWFQFVKNKTSKRIEDLMKWNSEHIIEALFLGDAGEDFKSIKNNLDTLRGIRNKLLHGDIEKPTWGNVRLCINTALALIPILQKTITSMHATT